MTEHQGQALPLSAAQTEVWYAQQLDPTNPVWNIAEYYVIEGPLDPVVFEAAVRATVEEAECLRVRFEHDGAEVRQIVEPCPDWEFPVLDVPSEADALEWMRRDVGTAFEVGRDRLFALALLRVTDERHIFYQRAHHLLWDGFSEALFARRVAEVYSAMVSGQSCVDTAFPPLSTLLDEEREYLASKQFDKDRDYWAARFTEPVELTSMSGRPVTPVREFLRRTAWVDPEVAERMRAVAWEARTAWPAFMIAVTAGFVQRTTGTRDVVLSLPVTARTTPATKTVPGMRANVLPVALTIRPDMTRADLLAHTSREVGQTLRRQRFRGQRVRSLMGLARDDRRPFGPELNVISFVERLRFGDCTATTHNLSTAPSDDLTLTVYDTEDGGLGVHVDANADLYDAEVLEAHLGRYMTFLRNFASVPADTPMTGIEVLGAEERRRLVTEWNDTASEDASWDDLVARVRSLAAERPDAVAVSDDSGAVSYADLVARASALSRRLLDSATGSGVVGVVCDPGIGFAVAVLGVLGAGLAWVPLDPNAPESRSAGVLADAGVRVLVVDPRYQELAERVGGSARVVVLDDAVDAELVPLRGSGDDLAYVI
ncbi:condensation domain-containing protein, partial [Goodfellowiella coeruleoviolacea]